MSVDGPTVFFWSVATPFLQQEGISKSTMMGFPCLRVKGDFFASADYRSGDLVVKLSAERVGEIIDSGRGEPFAPAGKTFREWVAVPGRDAQFWKELISESHIFVHSKAK